jgi:hypothetical protein
MRSTRVVCTVVALLTVLVAATALVTRPAGSGPATATALGKITSIDYADESFTMDLRRSNRLVGMDPLTVQATDGTIIKKCIGDKESVPIPFDEIELGYWARVDGMIIGDELVARRITVDPDNIPPSH